MEENELGITCVAAPIWDYTGTVVASVSVSGPTMRMQPERLHRLAERVRDTGIEFLCGLVIITSSARQVEIERRRDRVLQAIIMNFFGVYYAARGKAGIGMAVKSVLAMPPTYAVLLALAMKGFNWEVPPNIFSAIDLVAAATIPTVMLILGMQLAEIRLEHFKWGKIAFGVFVRMIASPAIAFILIILIPMDPLLEKVLIVSAAMPSAATTTMYALQFDTEPEMVSSITFITTLVSVFTVTILLAWLG